MLKPSFFSNVDLGALSKGHRLLFAGLWCWADKDGRLEDNPRQIKHNILPFDDDCAEELLDDLCSAGFIRRYQIGNVKVIQIVNFDKHQHPHPHEAPSLLPSCNVTASNVITEPARPSSVTTSTSTATSTSSDKTVAKEGLKIPTAQENKPQDLEFMDFDGFMYAWARHKGFKKPPKSDREYLAQQWAKVEITEYELGFALDAYCDSEWKEPEDGKPAYPIRLFISNPNRWVPNGLPRIPPPELAAKEHQPATDAAESAPARDRDYLKEWNEAVPLAYTEFDGAKRYAEGLRLAKLAPEFCEKFPDICRVAQGIRENDPTSTWLNFYYLLAFKDGSTRQNWRKVLAEMRGNAIPKGPVSGHVAQQKTIDDSPWYEGRVARKGEFFEADIRKMNAFYEAMELAERAEEQAE